ncbi:hypothetical protein [Nocardia sp. AG03]|uniref:hypothetical protein n=1 Tax=Nocardia sp. AG03 TaxID=3025312 RepID=UPI0024182746|nr:hypothetical protein [Nocardia sp. AG03]
MSWRDNTPQLVQDDVDNLLDSALTLAEGHLRDNGTFFPFGLAVDRAGSVQVIDVDAPDAPRAKTMLFAALSQLRSDLRAAAVITDVALPETASTAVRAVW